MKVMLTIRRLLLMSLLVLATAACDSDDQVAAEADEVAPIRTPSATVPETTTSSTPWRAEVPNVMTKTDRQATRILEKAGFEIDVWFKNSMTMRSGDVVNQIPRGGREVRVARVVTLTVIGNS